MADRSITEAALSFGWEWDAEWVRRMGVH